MREYAREQTAILLRRFAFELNRAAQSADADAIHDLRVAIRRLSRCLRVFAHFYPGHSWKKIRRQLSDLLHAAGAVRDCDIAVELLQAAGVPADAAVMARLDAERRKASHDLQIEVRRWEARGTSGKWRMRLALMQ